MKRIFFTAGVIFTCLSNAFCQVDRYMVPEDFFPHKGDTLKLHLFGGNTFSKGEEMKYDAQSKMKIIMGEAGKGGTDLTALAKDGVAPIITTVLQKDGVQMFTAIQHTTDEIDRKDFENFLSEDGLDKIADNLKQFQQSFKQKGVSVLKTIIAVDKNGGNAYEKPMKEDFEVILEQNPYKQNYGDDITGVVLLKGQPVKAARVNLVIRSGKGTEFPQELSTNEKGEFYFKMTREGVYLLRAINIVPSKDPDYDFDIDQTSLTFAFSSSNVMPYSYREFGLGNMH
ncbi:DUF4198 domain-containing protein [Mucilaginibacter sp. KACC 22063]|uniref:DUF4198 domain-containing protein n=1 Tax=Mucilaginibacter sp. KACC 22063 TaxID=3025666 RepID=UPI00236740E0|nr:DUF4198 domain-containing protein [Mucilaginibacter sp. KACC 22063]WDF56078.1 DUF4198 domain-containing protein [Mucilaginibacter sp. KACC 22063]